MIVVFMGKKKAVKKTKELSVAIAESSSLDAEGQQQQQPLTPRKRGRPRKIIADKTEAAGEVKEEEEAAQEGRDDIEGRKSQTLKISTEEEEKGQPSKMKEEAAATTTTTTTSSSSSKRQVPTKSRARRKSKPRKCS